MRASEIGLRARTVSLGMMWVSRAGKLLAVAFGAVIGGEIDGDAAAVERLRQRFGGKQMAAGPAGGEQHERRAARSASHRAPGAAAAGTGSAGNSVRGRSRVSASSMPMPQASEIIDEPP